MRDVDYLSVAQTAIEQIRAGAFLTVRAGARLNTMTIGWAFIGFCWRKPMFVVAVRDSRHTFSLLEEAEDFTVSIPGGDMRDAIQFCGTRSGREVDKFAACNLKLTAGRRVTSPIIEVAGLHFECHIVYRSAMDPAFLAEDFAPLYPQKDYHTLYFGEIMACYEI